MYHRCCCYSDENSMLDFLCFFFFHCYACMYWGRVSITCNFERIFVFFLRCTATSVGHGISSVGGLRHKFAQRAQLDEVILRFGDVIIEHSAVCNAPLVWNRLILRLHRQKCSTTEFPFEFRNIHRISLSVLELGTTQAAGGRLCHPAICTVKRTQI